jgi:hypothetical protein
MLVLEAQAGWKEDVSGRVVVTLVRSHWGRVKRGARVSTTASNLEKKMMGAHAHSTAPPHTPPFP